MNPHHWSEGPLWSFDTETTGLDPQRDRLVSAALLYVEPDGRAVVPSYSTIIDPGIEVPEAASAVNGLTTEHVRREGIAPAAALRYIVSLLVRCKSEGSPLVIMNAPFDWPFLLAECRRHGIQEPPVVPIFDPLLVDRHMDPYRKGSRRLEALCGVYGVTLDDAHEAGADAAAAAQVSRAIVRANPALLERTPRQLHTDQIGWYAAWREDINRYWEHRGETRRVTGSWPVGDLWTEAGDPDAERVG